MDTEGDILGVRIAAAIIDIIVVAILLVIFGGIIGGLIGVLLDSFLIISVISALIPILYFIILEGKYGQTAGKRLLNIAVVHEDGSPCTMSSSAIRNVLRIIDQLPAFYILGLVVMLLTDRTQRVGDLAGGTVVVRTE